MYQQMYQQKCWLSLDITEHYKTISYCIHSLLLMFLHFLGFPWIKAWYRGPDSNRHSVATGGFWIPCVYQFRHLGTRREYIFSQRFQLVLLQINITELPEARRFIGKQIVGGVCSGSIIYPSQIALQELESARFWFSLRFTDWAYCSVSVRE